MQLLKKIVEPEKILVSWQKSEGSPDGSFVPRRGRRYIIGQIVYNSGNLRFEYLSETEEFQKAIKEGFEGYPSFKTNKKNHIENVENIFIRRLPDRERSDFTDYLKYYRISPEAEFSDFALLAYTGGELPSDGFSFIPSYSENVVPEEFVLTLAGTRHYLENFDGISVGTEIIFHHETQNKYDPYAVCAYANDKVIGYVKKGQAVDFSKWINNFKIHSHIERINGNPAQPNVLVMGEISVKAS